MGQSAVGFSNRNHSVSVMDEVAIVGFVKLGGKVLAAAARAVAVICRFGLSNSGMVLETVPNAVYKPAHVNRDSRLSETRWRASLHNISTITDDQYCRDPTSKSTFQSYGTNTKPVSNNRTRNSMVSWQHGNNMFVMEARARRCVIAHFSKASKSVKLS